MRIVTGNTKTIGVTFYDDETAVTAGTVDVTVVNQAGDTIVDEQEATPGTDTGEYTYDLPAQATLGPLTVSWVGSRTATTYVEIVGSHLFTLQELRESDEMLSNTSRYDTADLIRVRDIIADEFQAITKRSFVRRRTVETKEALSGIVLLDNRDIRTVVDVDGTAFTGVFTPYGVVRDLTDGLVEITYEYGWEFVPEDVKKAALIRARYLLAAERSGIPDRATSYSPSDGGTYSLAVAGRAGWETGIPDVDAILARYKVTELSAVV